MNIDTFSNLLNAFFDKQNEILQSQDVQQAPTIGAMYEGLSEKILKKSIFKGIDLRVVKNSFIKGCPTEFDVMIVEGTFSKSLFSAILSPYPPNTTNWHMACT